MRFPGFTEEWKLKKLGEVATNKSEKYNPANEADSIKCIEMEHLATDTGQLLGYIDGSKSGSIKNVFNEGDVLFGKLRPYLRKYLQAPFDGVCSSEIWVLKGKNISNDFLYRIVQTKSFIDLANQSSGSKMPRADWNVVESGFFCIPTLAEQKKISSFLTLLDERIQTQNKIIKEQNVLKTTITKRIFSGQLRFKMDNKSDFPDWKLMTLGDIGEVKMCKRIFNDETSPTGDIPFFKIGSFGKEAGAFITKKLYEDYRNRFAFPKKGDILISAAGTIGRTVVYKGDDAYYQDSNIVWIDNNNTKIMNDFLYYILQIVKYNTEGGTIQRLYNNILKSTKINCPSLLEQKKIADCLSSIDSKIDIDTQILQKLEEQKKFLLQQIFV